MKYRILAILTLLLLLLNSCAPAQTNHPTAERTAEETTAPAEDATSEATQAALNDYPMTVIDGAGRELTFNAPPQRVVCFYTDCVEWMGAIGIKPIATMAMELATASHVFGEAGKDIEKLVQGDNGPDPEQIARLAPDLIVVYSEDEIPAVSTIAPVFVTYHPETLQDAFTSTQKFAAIFGRQAEAQAMIERFERRLAAYKALSPRNVTIMATVTWDTKMFWIFGGSLGCALLNEIAICEWPTPDGAGAYGYEGSVETLLQFDPDVITLRNGTEMTIEDLQLEMDKNPLWQEIRAVQTGRATLITLNDDATVEGVLSAMKVLDVFAPIIYPDIFPAPLTDEQVQEILADK